MELISLSTGIISQLQAAKDIGTLVTLLASIFGNGGTAAGAGTSLSSLIPPVARVGGGQSTFLLTMPTFAAQFSDALTLVHSGTQVLLRAQDGKPASFFVGDRYPVTLSLLSGSLGASTAATSVGAVTGGILPSASYNVGIGPVALTSADFRNVGLQDLAVVNEIDNTLTILQNQGLGIFLQASGSPISLGAARTTAPAIAPSIASAVLTTSGFHDLLVTDPVANTVQVLLSNGDDTFKAGHRFAYHRGPAAQLHRRRRFQCRWQSRFCGDEFQGQYFFAISRQRRWDLQASNGLALSPADHGDRTYCDDRRAILIRMEIWIWRS